MTRQHSPSEDAGRELDARQGEAHTGDQRETDLEIEHAEGVRGPEGIAERADSPPPDPPVPLLARSRTTRRAEREDVGVRAARVKVASRIEDIVRSNGIALATVGGGRRLVGLCPFHQEEHASFTV